MDGQVLEIPGSLTSFTLKHSIDTCTLLPSKDLLMYDLRESFTFL